MEEFDVYKDIAERTGGDIYIGVVGPVRSGKSTFITNFMNALVMPNAGGYELDRMRDELPQSAEGRTIMTTQPKFVPSEAAKITLSGSVELSVRLVDCVGYLVDGVNGHLENGESRMVKTPWYSEAIPFERAAEIGTKKVITEHATIGVVMTSDGSIRTELAREAYVQAEERCVNELKALKKPFVVVLNSSVPDSEETRKLAAALTEKYGVAVLPIDVKNLSSDNITKLLERVLYEFPVRDIFIETAAWIRALSGDDGIVTELVKTAKTIGEQICRMSDCTEKPEIFNGSEFFDELLLKKVEPDKGRVTYAAREKPQLFYRALSEKTGVDIADEFSLMACMTELIKAKREYDKIAAALKEVDERGYGVVTPTVEEMTLQDPQIFKQGSRFGVKLKASAPSLHIMRVDIETEVCPVVGSEQQSEDLVNYLMGEFENNPGGIWQTNMFGKSLDNLVNEGINGKLAAMPEETQKKMRKTLSRIINEGRGGVLCILL